MSTAPHPSERSEYSYNFCLLTDPDNEIRILTLHQGLPNDPVTCTLQTRRLTAFPETRYEALSYSWGTDRATKSIGILHGEAGYLWSSPFMVRPNLYSALQQLRYEDRPRELWVDAICINQNDNREKNFQVPLMDKIYIGAANVCIWLGTETEDSSLALNFIGRVLNLGDADRAIIDIRTAEEWPALASLMRREWFSRRWVIQEISLARQARLHCGDKDISWSEFAEAVSILEAVRPEEQIITSGTLSLEQANKVNLSKFLSEMPLLAATRLVDLTDNVFRKSDKGTIQEKVVSLEVLMSELSSFQVSKPHDVIYAVLGLAKDISSIRGPKDLDAINSSVQENRTAVRAVKLFKEPSNPFHIDYDKDFLDVCKEFLEMTFKRGGSLDMLCRPWVPVVEDRVLPSWLTTIAQTAYSAGLDGEYNRINADTLVGSPGQGKGNYNADGKGKLFKKWTFGTEEKKHSLFVEGFIVDKVGLTNQHSQNGLIPNDWLATGGWVDLTAAPPPEFWKTLVANRGPKSSNCPRVFPRACKVLIPVIEGDDISTKTLLNKAKSRSIDKFLRRVQAVICMRSLFRTDRNEFLGLAPTDAKQGDLICILYGCSVPVVLRSVREPEAEDHYYKFVGECYVHGLMEAEAFAIQKQEREARAYELKQSKDSIKKAALTIQRTFELR